MLLSLYASFRWAGTDYYVLKMASLIILVSFFSASVGVGIGSFLFGPLPVLSFPFYAIQDEMHGAPVPSEGYSYWIPTYRIHFLTAEISNLKANDSAGMWTYQLFGYHVTFLNMKIWYIDQQSLGSYRFTFPFLFFILVNIAGAILGYGINKLRTIQKIERDSMGLLVRVALGVAILTVGTGLSAIVVRTGPAVGDYYYPFGVDGSVFTIFGITWLAIAIAEFLDRYL